MTEGKTKKVKQNMSKVISKIAKEKKTKRRFSSPFNQIPLGTVFNALEGLRKEERLSYWHQEYYPGDLITGKVKRKPQFSVWPRVTSVCDDPSDGAER